MMTTVGCIGLGNMGSIVTKIVAHNHNAPVLVASRNQQKVEKIAKHIRGRSSSTQQVMEEADIIFLGLKPAQLPEFLTQYRSLLEQAPSKLFISMAAGVKVSELEQWIPSKHRIIRMMPNTSMRVRKGVTTFVTSDNTSENDVEQFRHLLKRSGLVIEIDENQMDAATAVAGCGPAFVYLFIEAMADAGVMQGLSREMALQLAAKTVEGAGRMVLDTEKHPGQLKDEVCSPGGSTIAGVHSLEVNGLRASVELAVDASLKKTQQLSQKD